MRIESFLDELGAVVWARSVGKKCLAVGFGAVTFVVEPIVVGKLVVEFLHVKVSFDFGKNAGCGD